MQQSLLQKKQVDQETARRATQDARAVEKPVWFLGDATFDMLGWHDNCLEDSVVPVAAYNRRNTTDPLDIEYRVEDRIEEHTDDVQLK